MRYKQYQFNNVDEDLRRKFFFPSRRRHTRLDGDWSSDVCSSDLHRAAAAAIVSRNGPAAQAAAHLLESAVPGDGEAVAVLQRAAAETAGQAPRTAAELALGADRKSVG